MTLLQLLTYNHWANKRLYAHLFRQNASYRAPAAIEAFVEMLRSQKCWCDRVEGIDQEEKPGNMDLGSSEWLWLNNKKRLDSYLAIVDKEAHYMDSYGKPQQRSNGEILHEVILEGMHYRGKILAHLKQQKLREIPLSYNDYLNTQK